VDLLFGFSHGGLESNNLFSDLLSHEFTGHEIALGVDSIFAVNGEWRTSDSNHSTLVVKEENLDAEGTIGIAGVFHIILTVVKISDFTWDFLGLWLVFSQKLWVSFNVLWDWNLLGDFDFEGISTGSSVFTVIILGNDLELGWALSSTAFKKAWSVSKRSVGSGVEEVLERNESVGEIAVSNGELHNTFLWSECLEVWSNASELSLGDENARDFKSLLGDSVDSSAALSEEDSNVGVFDTLTIDGELDSTGELTEAWVGSGNGIRWTDDFSNR